MSCTHSLLIMHMTGLGCVFDLLSVNSSSVASRTKSSDDEDDGVLHVQCLDEASVFIPLHFRSSS